MITHRQIITFILLLLLLRSPTSSPTITTLCGQCDHRCDRLTPPSWRFQEYAAFGAGRISLAIGRTSVRARATSSRLPRARRLRGAGLCGEAALIADRRDEHDLPLCLVHTQCATLLQRAVRDGHHQVTCNTTYVQIKMATPSAAIQAEYYDGHYREHNYGYWLAVDKDGECCAYAGHVPGRHNDVEIWQTSDMYQHPERWFGDFPCKVLADGIFSRINEDRFIVPICYLGRDLNEDELRYNMFQAWDRAIMENFNNRIKRSCNYLSYFTFGIDSINAITLSCIILTNIRIRYQDRLRYSQH